MSTLVDTPINKNLSPVRREAWAQVHHGVDHTRQVIGVVRAGNTFAELHVKVAGLVGPSELTWCPTGRTRELLGPEKV